MSHLGNLSSEIPKIQIFHLMLPQRSLRLSLFIFIIFFSFFSSASVISTILSCSSRFCSVSIILLLIPSSVFLVNLNYVLFIADCLFFVSSWSLLNISCIFFICAFQRLISFRMDWLDLLVQGTLMSLQHHTSKASILQHSAFFTV